MADNIRSIPSVADGLKPGQRKVIWACFKRKLKTEIKVSFHFTAQLYPTNLNLFDRLPNLPAISLRSPATTTVNRACK